MDELLVEFLTETGEGLDQLDVELVRFEQEPNNAEMLNTIFRLVHTVKGTCGFLGLSRLAKLAHAAETLMGQYRDGAPVTVEGVSVILASIDRIKEILAGLERDGTEPPGSDADLIGRLQRLALDEPDLARGEGYARAGAISGAETAPMGLPPVQAALDDLERAWRAAPGPDAGDQDTGVNAVEAHARETHARVQTVRVNVDTLEHLMTTVSELVLARNQLLDLMRRTGESEFKSPLQRLSTVTAELQEGIMKADGSTPVAVGIEERGELYGLIADRVGDVLWLKPSSYETNPVNLDPRWMKVCAGVHRLDEGLLVVLDVDKVLDLNQFGVAA